jgi:hypothetical protein
MLIALIDRIAVPPKHQRAPNAGLRTPARYIEAVHIVQQPF